MKIAQINANDRFGGAAEITNYLKNGFDLLGHKSIIVAGKKHSNNDEIFSLYGNPFELVKKNFARLSNDLTGNQFLFYPTKKLKNIIDNFSPDVVNLHNLHGYYFNLPILKKLNIKKIFWTAHDMWLFTGHCSQSFECENYKDKCGKCPNLKEYPRVFFDSTEKLIFKKKNIYKDLPEMTIIAPSEWMKTKIENSILKNHPIKVINNGIDSNIYKRKEKIKSRIELNIPTDKKVVLFIASGGIKNHYKGGDYFLMEAKKRQADKDVVFIALGDNEKTEHPNIITIPEIKDKDIISKYYSSSDCLYFPSKAENFPLVLLEAIMCQLPALSFKNGGIPEIIEHKTNGYLAENRNFQDLSNGLDYILSRPDLIKNEYRDDFAGKFSANKMTENYLNLYSDLI